MSYSDQEIEEFKVEALELLEVAEKSLLALDQGAEFRSSFDAVFRGFHNLKGASGMIFTVGRFKSGTTSTGIWLIVNRP